VDTTKVPQIAFAVVAKMSHIVAFERVRDPIVVPR
jgi:hypothetical protein